MQDIGKRGQMTLFIIVAVVIVALIILFFLFRGNVENFFGIGQEFSPNVYLSDCVEPEIRPAVELLASQGGYQNPEGFITYNKNKIKYLCYTNDDYKTCTIQQPMIEQHFEKELNEMVKDKANRCMSSLIEEYKKRGYQISSAPSQIKSEVTLMPGKIHIKFDASLSVSKDGTSRAFNGFEAEMKSEMYDLLFISSSIVEYETELGDSATELYLNYYPNLKIEKIELDNSVTIYKISHVITKEEFTFASRSLAWPAGYGFE